MRRLLTLKLLVAGLVCLAAVSGQDTATTTEPLVDATAGETTTVASAEEPVSIAPTTDTTLVEEPAPEPVLEPQPVLESEPVLEPDTTTVAAAPMEEEKPIVEEGTTAVEPDAPAETTAVEAEAPADTTTTAAAPVEEKPLVEDAAAVEGELPLDETPQEEFALEGEGDVLGQTTLGGDLNAAEYETVPVEEVPLDTTPQDEYELEGAGDLLGETTMGGNLNEAVYETVPVEETSATTTDLAGGALDGLGNVVNPGKIYDAAQTAGDIAGTANNKLANAGGSNGGAGTLNSLDGALPGGDLLDGDLLGEANQPVAPSTTGTNMAGDDAVAVGGGDTLMPDKAEAPVEEDTAMAFPEHLYITAFECDVDQVLVTEQDNYVTCAVSAESSAGVKSLSAAFYNPPMNKRFLMSFGPEQLVEGDATKGTWSLDLTIPKGADQGVWALGFADQGAFYGLEVVDAKGNVVNYSQTEALKTIAPLQQRLTVQSYKGNGVAFPQANIVTSTGLRLHGLSCELPEVTVTAAPADVPCTALVSPDEAGLGKVLAHLVGPTGRTALPLTFDETAERTLVPATETTEEMVALAGKVHVPTWAEPGTYNLADSGAYQPRTVSHAGTVRLASPAMLTRKASLHVVSASDRAAPHVSNFYCNQGQKVDLSGSDAVGVNCILRAADDLSGVSYAAMHFVSPSRQDAVEFAFVPPSPGLGPFPNVAVPQVADTVQAHFPPLTEPGAWTLARAVVADQAGNYKEYAATELDQLNVQTFFLVQNPARSFAIRPRDGSDKQAPGGPGATSAASIGSRPSALLLAAAAVASGLLGLAAVLF